MFGSGGYEYELGAPQVPQWPRTALGEGQIVSLIRHRVVGCVGRWERAGWPPSTFGAGQMMLKPHAMLRPVSSWSSSREGEDAWLLQHLWGVHIFWIRIQSVHLCSRLHLCDHVHLMWKAKHTRARRGKGAPCLRDRKPRMWQEMEGGSPEQADNPSLALD